MQDITRSYTGTYLREVDDGLLSFRFSTDALDRHGTIVVPSGIDVSQFGGSFFWGHDSSGSMLGGAPDIRNVLGKVQNLRVVPFERDAGSSGEALEGDVRFASKENPRARFAETMVRAGFLGETSIGFKRKQGGSVMKSVPGIKGKTEVHERTSLLEISLVGVGSNPETAALIRSIADELPPGDAVPAVLAEYGKAPFDRKAGMPTAEEIVQLLIKEIGSSEGFNSRIRSALEGRSESRAAPPPVSGADIGKAVRRWRSRSRRDRAIRARA